MSDPVSKHIANVLDEVTALRRDLHANPELSAKEHNTSGKVRELLATIEGLEVLPPFLGTDVVAVLNGNRRGPCLALRADLDALPISEETGLPYQSTVPGVMHACGHDGHTVVLLGTAMVLARLADSLPGRVVFIFQPDEEDGGGGGRLCERGVLESLKVDAAVALHGWPSRPVGTIVARPGPIMAANNCFEVTVRGVGSHGAYPHRGIDPIVTAAHIVVGLQSIVARTVNPLEAAVVTVGQIAGGTATNVIPSECRFKGTLRYTSPPLGEHLRQRLRRVAEDTARAHGAEAAVEIMGGYPPMVNDPDLTRLIQDAVQALLGQENLVVDEPVSMGVEDFAFYAQRVPAMMFRLGLRPPEQDSYPSLHTPLFDFNDAALPVGIRMFCEIARRFLARPV